MPATGFTHSAVTNADGAFSFPGMNVGTYTVTVKLSGFKTFVSNNVVLTSGAGANVRATLEIGGIEEQVIVSSASEIVQTQSTTISSTINIEPDHEAAADQPQRDGLRQLPARRVDSRRQPRRDDQRPAAGA